MFGSLGISSIKINISQFISQLNFIIYSKLTHLYALGMKFARNPSGCRPKLTGRTCLQACPFWRACLIGGNIMKSSTKDKIKGAKEDIMNRILAVLIMFCIFSSPALCIADDFGPQNLRCNATMISVGASTAEVLSSCGSPISKSIARSSSETWTYNFGPNDFIYLLTFESQKLT